MITQELANNLFQLKNGNLFWKNKTSNLSRIKIGDEAGVLDKKGYKKIGINQKIYFEHHIVFLMNHGYLPKQIDHINGVKNDNRIENLREVTNSQNKMNTKLQSNNKSGIKNVNWCKKSNKWVVQLAVDNKKRWFGYYYDLNVAKFVAETMRYKYHGKFARNY